MTRLEVWQPGSSDAVETESDPVRRGYDGVKRALDIAGALVGLLLVSPLMLAATLIIWVSDGRPVLHAQWRVRHGARLFRMYKFRTMYRDAERAGEAACARRDDPRIIPACRWMRRAHVDELPQLFSVLRGDMSLVGPRPERPEVVHGLRAHIANFSRRTAVKPGLTGLAQVRNGYTNDLDGHRRKLEYDLLYLRKRSLLTDLRLLLATFGKLWDRSAC